VKDFCPIKANSPLKKLSTPADPPEGGRREAKGEKQN
jgi:hypothetical protein